jgi:hypothetical protein
MLMEKNCLSLEKRTRRSRKILENIVILINICANPDGRGKKALPWSNGVDLNRDYLTQSQPEIQAIVKHVAVRWFPSVVVDLHGYFGDQNITIDGCTLPHNPIMNMIW